VFEVTISDDLDLDDYEIVEEGKPYREWIVATTNPGPTKPNGSPKARHIETSAAASSGPSPDGSTAASKPPTAQPPHSTTSPTPLDKHRSVQPRHNWDRVINWTLTAIGVLASITLIGQEGLGWHTIRVTPSFCHSHKQDNITPHVE
jgi:hypothetical protein